MADPYAWMDSLDAAPKAPKATKGGADPYAWMDSLGAEPAAAPPSLSVPGLRDRFEPKRAPKGFEDAARAADAVHGKPVEPDVPPVTTGGEAFRRGTVQGATLGFGDEAAAALETGISKIPGLRDAYAFVDKHTGGAGPDALPLDDPSISYSERRNAKRDRNALAEREHGGKYLGGELVGGLVAPIPGGSEVGAARGLVQGLKAGVKTGAKIGGIAGLGNSTADLTKGDVVGAGTDLVKGEITGALAGGATTLVGELGSRFVKGAAKRVLDRSAVDVTTGEQNAGKRITAKFTERAGEDNERLASVYERHPDVEKVIALHASTNPEKAAKGIASKMSEIGDKLDGIEAKMEEHGRSVQPTEIIAEFDRMMGDRMKSGDLDAIKALRKARDGFAEEFGNYGPLSAGQLRGLKRTAARQAFVGDPTAPASIKAQVEGDVWRVFGGAQERAAKATPGVDVDELKALNTDMSVLMPMRRTLDERAASAKADRKSIGHIVGGAAAGAAGMMTHGVGGLVAGLAAPLAYKAGKAVVRRADYALAADPYLANLLEGLNRGLALPAAVEAAQGAARSSE